MELNIWQEKYRPRKISDMILSDNFRESFESFVENREVPHLILSGPPGVGKTTLMKILSKNLDAQVLKLNGSDDRGIGVIRNQIKDFVGTKSFQKWKIVAYDEGEKLTPDAWGALKGLVELHSKRARFIFTTNVLRKIPEANRSRCQIFEFKKLEKEQILEYYRNILTKESVKFTEDNLEKVYKICNGDLRRSLNYLQQNSRTGTLVLVIDEFLELFKEIKTSMTSKKVSNLKEYFAAHSVDWESLYRYIYERVDHPVKLAIVGKYLYQHAFIVDPEINFVSMVCELMKVK